MRPSLFVSEVPVSIPLRAFEFNGFRRWLHTATMPEDYQVSFINDAVEMDQKMEEFFEHGQVKAEIAAVLHRLVKEMKFGRFAPDGTRFSNLRSKLSTEPDGMVISNEAFKSRRVRLVSGKRGNGTEVIGTPDIVIEVVSRNSKTKDAERLMTAYYKARIPEYWLVDVLDDRLEFDIYRRRPSGYVAARKADGWAKSQVLGKSFRLVRGEDAAGSPDYTLEVR